MIGQRALSAVALVAGLTAALLFYASVHRVPVVVALAALTPGHAIGADDVGIRELPPDAVPAGALADAAGVAGRFPRAPIWPGQLVLAGAIAPTSAAFESGIAPPTGYRAVAIPVTADRALGGAVAAGARIDVIAVPLDGRAPADRTAEIVVEAALVLDVRGEHGGPVDLGRDRARGTVAPERLGSVVIAVGPSYELILADRIATSSFVLVLVPERP